MQSSDPTNEPTTYKRPTTHNPHPHPPQAYLWNRAASEHIRHYGCRAVEGDLVLLPPPASDPTPTEPPDGSGKGKGTGASGGKPRVRALEQAEVEGAKGEELIYEVVLPLPGPGVEMPGHRIGEVRCT